MAIKTGTILWTFVSCMFTGIIIVSIGLGAVFPSINRISKPFVCPRGEMTLETQVYRPTPVETVTILNWYCVDEQTGAKTEIGLLPLVLPSGIIFGLLFFVAALIGMMVLGNRARGPSAF